MASVQTAALQATNVEGFWDDGFAVIDDVLTTGEVEVLRASVDVLERWATTNPHEHFAAEPDSAQAHPTLRKIQAIHRHGGTPWAALLTKPAVLDLFERLLGPHIQFHHSKLMLKPPFEGSAKHWHQDLSEGFIAPAEIERLLPMGAGLAPEQVPVVAIQYYLDDSTRGNGCLEVVPGSHRRGLHTNPLGPDLVDPAEVVSAEVPAGGALLFHCLTYHYSAPNTSALKRRAPVYEYFAPTDSVALLPRQYDYGLQVRPAQVG